MRTVGKRLAVCPFCLEEHELKEVEEKETTIFKGERITYKATRLFCETSEEFFEDEKIIGDNDLRIKDAYRERLGLLKSSDIVGIRNKYGITQGDLCQILQWGGKTITRYESHQVQDKAHDMILRKLSEDPSWYIDCLIEAKDSLSEVSYRKYYEIAQSIYENSEDYYLRKCIKANCTKHSDNPLCVGNTELSFSKIIDIINYYASSKQVTSLYKVKLMKLMWYADFLSYKTNNHSITGLPYLALPMGAVPECHNYIIRLKGVPCEEVVINGSEAYWFKTAESKFPSLTEEDKDVLDKVISVMGNWETDRLVKYMHKEVAFRDTKQNEIISYEYAKELSI